jgi:cystathionine beta-lyase
MPPSDTLAPVGNPFDALTLEDLQRRRSEKWRTFQPDVLPVWLAEMDYPLAEPIQRILAEMVTRGDTGYVTRSGLPEAYGVRGQSVRSGGGPLALLSRARRDAGRPFALELFTAPGDGVGVNPPVYAPFFRTIAFAGRRVIEAPLGL